MTAECPCDRKKLTSGGHTISKIFCKRWAENYGSSESKMAEPPKARPFGVCKERRLRSDGNRKEDP